MDRGAIKMLSFIKLFIWFVLLVTWLFGKLYGNEIRTTFRDWFPFLCFIYLLVTVVLADNIWKFYFWQCLILIFFILEIYKDVIRGIRYFVRGIKGVNILLKQYDRLNNFLFKEKIEDTSELLLIFLFIGITYFQLNNNVPTINLIDKSSIEILGFIIAILSMYGIYIGFLQYLAGDDRSEMYLGRSKVNYLIEESFWYYATQSKIFIIMLLSTILIPIAVKINTGFTKELTVLWQTSYFLLLVIYIFLLGMSLYVIQVAFLMKAKEDENLKNNIAKNIQQNYTEIFWFVFYNRDRYHNDFIKNKLTRDFSKLDISEYEKFVTNIFEVNYFDARNLYGTIHNQLEIGFELTRTQKLCNKIATKYKIFDDKSWLKSYQDKNEYDLGRKWRDFYEYFKTFISDKWSFLKLHKDNFSPEIWQKLILEDLKNVTSIVKLDPTRLILKNEYPEKEQDRLILFHRGESIREFLFKLLIEKTDVNLDDILKNVKEEIQRFSLNESDQFYRYEYDFLKFRLVTILDKYENDDVNINLPEYKSLSDVFQNNQRNDFENSMLYSKICFNYLDRGRIEDFSHTKVEADDSKEKEKQKTKAQKIQKLILSMNEEYRLAYMLYQLFYTDNILWDHNLTFYDSNIQSIMKCDKQYHYYLFNQVKKIILSETDMKHRITESFLDKLWETKNETIMDFSWFDHFGTRHKMSNFKILYVQWILSGATTSYLESRINFEREFPIKVRNSLVGKIKENRRISVKDLNLKWRIRDKEKRIGHFCRDYLLLTDQLTTIFTKESYSYKQNNLQLSVEYLLHSGKVNLSDVIDNISVTSLLRLEWLLRWNYYHYYGESNYTSRTFFNEMTSNDRYYWSAGRGILEFFIVKIIDNFYRDLYQDKEFMASFKSHLELQLNSLNKTVEEYVELIAERVSGIDNISILQKGQIISKLNNILFGQDNNIKIR
ncbi:TPA: hypothetical protein ACGOVN_001363 [Streptococcus suis]